MLNTNYTNYNTPAFKSKFIVPKKTAKTVKSILKNVEGPYPFVSEKTGRVYFGCPDPNDVIDNRDTLWKHKITFLLQDDKSFEKLMSDVKKEAGRMKRSETRFKKDLQRNTGNINDKR